MFLRGYLSLAVYANPSMPCLKTSFDSVKIVINTLLWNQYPGMVSHDNESNTVTTSQAAYFCRHINHLKLFCGALTDQLIKGDIPEALGSGCKLSIFKEE